ncbi:MAG TPA: PA14 domain-containing protein [Sedimentisphaerales bacterium]|nr:PA14 domain-containing protein [Sedimentisphaerales bacterium]
MIRRMAQIILVCVCVAGTSNLVYAIEGLSLSRIPSVVQEAVQHGFVAAYVTGIDGGDTLAVSTSGAPMPGSDELPLQYLGPGLADRWAPDGHLMYSPGVQNIQISRANRRRPPNLPPAEENRLGWTYQHHPGIGCWKGKLYAVWDMTHKDEDIPPCHVVYSTSSDGFHWSQAKDLYPFNKAYNLRFYFFHSSNGRMLVFAAGFYPTNDILEAEKETLLVREITADHKLGEIYTLIKPGPSHPPLFEQSKDAGFVEACREAVNNRPLLEQADYGVLLGERRMKWHDEKNWPGGSIGGVGDFWVFGKALCFFHRKDGTLVGLCKMGFVTQSADEGKTWSLPVIPKGVVGGSGKLWAQETPDGRYAMIYIPQRSARYPMAVTTSDDGITFGDMRVIHGEVSPQRYAGRAKGGGPQYLRGVAEWGGDAPSLDNDSIWVIYSVNKEDIWVSRIPVPIAAGTEGPVHDTFDEFSAGPRVPGWNTYSPIWAPVRVVSEPGASNKYLELADREPTDYARAIRTFASGKTVDVSFRVNAGQADRGKLNIELLGDLGTRPVRIVLNDRGRIQAVKGQAPRQVETLRAPGAGLVGTYYNNVGFDDPEDSLDYMMNVDPLLSVDQDWGKSRGSTWSARWRGFIEGPYTGEVRFEALAIDGIRLEIGGTIVIDGLSEKADRSGKINMTEGKKMPITLEFESSSGKARLKLFWQWNGQPKTVVPAEALSHDPAAMPEKYNIFDFRHRYADGYIAPVDVCPYEANIWNDFRIHADCSTGKYRVAVNGREIIKDADFAEPSSMVYALSFRTGDKTVKYRSMVSTQDLLNTEEPLVKISYRIDDVMTGNLEPTQ